jgi:hypothetical protein
MIQPARHLQRRPQATDGACPDVGVTRGDWGAQAATDDGKEHQCGHP